MRVDSTGIAGRSLAAFLAIACAAVCARDLRVTEFGAKGDGVTDDTAALQRAADALASANGWSSVPFRRGRPANADFEGPLSRLVFPKGRYRITAPVIFGRKTVCLGERGAEIVQEDPKADAFYCFQAYICRFENLAFFGGACQIDVHTHNSEGANIRVKGCRFLGANECGVQNVSWRVAGPKFDSRGHRTPATPVGKWMRDRQTKRYVRDPRWNEPLNGNNNSTLTIIEDSLFDDCETAVNINPDGAVVRRCRILSRRSAPSAMVIHNSCHAYELDVTVRRNPGADVQSAIACLDSRLCLWLEDSRFRTDDGTGVPVLLYSGVKPSGITPLIVMENVDAECGGGRGVVHIVGGRPANALGLIRVRNSSGDEAPAVSFDSTFSEASLAEIRPSPAIGLEKLFAITLKDCAGLRVPEGLAARFLRPCPDFAGRDLVDIPRFPAGNGPLLRAEDDGVDENPDTDDTAAMERFVARLSAEPGAVGILPATMITVTNTLSLRGSFTLAGEGLAVIRGASDTTDFFRAEAGSSVTLANLQIRGGRAQVHARSGARVFVDYCFLYDPVDTALRVDAGGELHLDGGMSYAMRLYDGAGTATLSEIWYRFLPTSNANEPFRPSASIVNRGRLQIWDLLGVPVVFRRWSKYDMGDPSHPIVEFRWVDNFGEYASRGMRYGGEWGGLAYVFHYGPAKTLIEAGYGSYNNTSTHPAPVIADSADPDVRFFTGSLPYSRNSRMKALNLLWRPAPEAPLVPIDGAAHFYSTCPQP